MSTEQAESVVPLFASDVQVEVSFRTRCHDAGGGGSGGDGGCSGGTASGCGVSSGGCAGTLAVPHTVIVDESQVRVRIDAPDCLDGIVEVSVSICGVPVASEEACAGGCI